MNQSQAVSLLPYTFGPFRIVPRQHLLLRAGVPIRLNSRAWEILLVLLEHPGQVVSKREFLARVWPGVLVEDGTLRVHIAALRKALEDGKEGTRYVENVTGHGYRFIAPVTPIEEEAAHPLAVHTDGTAPQLHDLVPLAQIIGREKVVDSLVAWLSRKRMITVVGPGGIGKTAVGMAVAHQVRSAGFQEVCPIDLESIPDPAQVAASFAAALGVPVAPDPVASIEEHLRSRRTLLVLDSCERLAEPLAGLVEELLTRIPGLHILATSREPLRARNECVFRLTPLYVPPPFALLTAAEALRFPSVSLFTQRAMESRATFEFEDAEAPVVTEICRKLDGLPLAIELAAASTEFFGVRALAANLDDCLRLLTRGHRTALLRHRTLRATIDWSYEALSPIEQTAWRRLAVFDGSFDVEAASAMLADEEIHAVDVLDLVTSLAAKSLVTTHATSERVLFRLLHTSRAYALEKLGCSNESDAIKLRHVRLRADGT